MKKRLSVLLAMTILATSLPVTSMRAAETNRNATVVCTDTEDSSLKENDEMESNDATEQIDQGETEQQTPEGTEQPSPEETEQPTPEPLRPATPSRPRRPTASAAA